MRGGPSLLGLCAGLLGVWSCAQAPVAARLQAAAPVCDFDGIDTESLSPAAWEQSRRLDGRREHQRLRPGQPEPTAPRQVRIAIDATHHTSNQMSLYAARGPDGLWRADVVESSGGGMSPATEKITRTERAFSPVESARIERLLADSCLYSEPTRITTELGSVAGLPEYCSSMVVTEVVVVTASGTRRSVQECGSWGVAGRLARLLAHGR